jgi:hypothetical protein
MDQESHYAFGSAGRSGWIRRITHGGSRMTTACPNVADVSVTHWYDCVTRCVRRAFLLGQVES